MSDNAYSCGYLVLYMLKVHCLAKTQLQTLKSATPEKTCENYVRISSCNSAEFYVNRAAFRKNGVNRV